MKELTVCILVHEHHETLALALHSVNWAEHVLIMDSQSGIHWAQDFPEVARKAQIVMVPQPIPDFAAVRNQALVSCHTPWILFLDSDEVLSVGAELELLRVIQSGAQAGVVYRSDVFLGHTLTNGEAGNQPLVRLCQKNATQFAGSVHERPTVHGSITTTSITIQHYAHRSITEFITAVNTYAQMAAQEERFQKMSRLQVIWQLCSYPPLKFIQNYILRGGMSDAEQQGSQCQNGAEEGALQARRIVIQS